MNIPQLAPEELVALIAATSFAAGLNVYAAGLTVGLLAHAGALVLPPPLEPLANWWVIGACSALFALEFVADKIPVVDLGWNALQTFVRVPAAALLGYGAATHLSQAQQMLAAMLGGAIALAAHTGKTAVRAAVTPSPEPFSNAVLSLGEDVVAIALTWFATSHPYIAAAIVALLLVVMAWLLRALVRTLRALFFTRATAR